MIANMDRRELCARVADLAVPVDDHELGKQELGEALIAEADQERADYLEWLLLFDDDDEQGEAWDGDPVLLALDRASRQINWLQNLIYRLVAYAREIPPPGHTYTLEQLAAAARMSVSGVRSCYTVGDIDAAAENLVTGSNKRGAPADRAWDRVRVTRWQCPSRAMEDALDKLVAEGAAVAGPPEELRAGKPDSQYAIVDAFSTTERAYLLPNATLTKLLGEELSRRPGAQGRSRRPRRTDPDRLPLSKEKQPHRAAAHQGDTP
ncbi:hypothetical protein H7J87_12355 [Mycolicibacterium wolinskyi]|uniref:Uncharacterized protein n=1 Tax=Mycolicibacterium wolinskyi TaxID=59750 RepID=A0A1X2FJN6_9MYCO|nr:hypothetical protein [Mycolicibacterium wolinskyi]MCV7296316.1 hypothetical protein [Mycolicibacterium goodii]ORX18538.1 hypothetical protein AWC31_14675 [Mycolicibacterium wolinskyi]